MKVPLAHYVNIIIWSTFQDAVAYLDGISVRVYAIAIWRSNGESYQFAHR